LFHELAHQLGGDLSYVTADTTSLAESLGLQGAHSHSNVALAVRHAAHGSRFVRPARANRRARVLL
jgi:hypothetical protein